MMRTDLPPLPRRMATLPLDERGYPVPWFVDWIDGEPKFQLADLHKWRRAVRNNICWVCGRTMGVFKGFVVGPMCGINRVSAEPPSHVDCAVFAATGCPFLTRPMAKRSTRGIQDIKIKEMAGVSIKRNPGVTLLWVTKSYSVFRAPNGQLIKLGEPTEVRFYREGRAATRAEIDESVASGLPALQEPANAEGPRALVELDRMLKTFHGIVDAHFKEDI